MKKKKSLNDFEKEIKQKTKKYFIQQKILEISAGVGGIFGFIFIPYWLGIFLGQTGSVLCLENSGNSTNSTAVASLCPPYSTGDYWLTGLILTFCLCVLGFFAYQGIKNWIRNNWRKARSRAIEEIRSREGIPYKF